MGRNNNGMIVTNQYCIACNHCVEVCPVVGANITSASRGRIGVDVSDKKCIHCGRCLNVCNHNARAYIDGTAGFLKGLKRGEKIAVIVDPVIYMANPTIEENIYGYLKSLGVSEFYDGSIGGDISIYCNTKYLKDNIAPGEKTCKEFLAHTCPAMANFFETNEPGMLEYMIPVQLPMVCAAIYIRKYLGESAHLALLTPCVAIYDELESYGSGKSIDYLVTLKSLLSGIAEEELGSYRYPCDFKKRLPGTLIGNPGEFARVVKSFFGDGYTFTSYDGLSGKIINTLKLFAESKGHKHHTLLEISSCDGGCMYGPGIDDSPDDYYDKVDSLFSYNDDIYASDTVGISPSDRYKFLCERYANIECEDFAWKGVERFRQTVSVPQSVVDEIFEKMHKDSVVKQNINCRACGYNGCRDLACAIANGYARLENCVQYMQDEIRSKRNYDMLTGLLNQHGFMRECTRLLAINKDKDYVVAVGDINKLSAINELYGNAAGDMVLKNIAKWLTECVEGRGLCARFGGGVFAVLVEDSEDVIDLLQGKEIFDFKNQGIDFPISVKIGYEKRPGGSVLPINKYLNDSTYAYRCAKNRSVNSLIQYSPDMEQKQANDIMITQRMHKAMANGEFVVYLQPKYNHRTGKLNGAEALSRWIDNDGKMISPGNFIPIFEKNGFVVSLDRYVWEVVFKLIEEWIDTGRKPIPVSVNISRVSLATDDILEKIRVLRDEYYPCREYVQFEITESAYISNSDDFYEKVREIRNLGFKVAMDDFGSGYSSLSVLKDAPLDILKLDMGFVRGNRNSERGNIIIKNIVDMIKELSLEMVAEGVETREQANMLTEMGCEIIQGYYYAKPMPIADFEELL